MRLTTRLAALAVLAIFCVGGAMLVLGSRRPATTSTTAPSTTAPTTTASTARVARNLVYWSPKLLVDDAKNASATVSATWWNDGLQLLMLALLSAVLSNGPGAPLDDRVHFLVISNVDAAVLHDVLAAFVRKAAAWVQPAELQRVLHTWRVSTDGFRSCASWALRGEIVAYPRLHDYDVAMYLDTDVLIKKPLTVLFADFTAHITADPAEAHLLHVVPETTLFWSEDTYARGDLEMFRTNDRRRINATDMAARAAHSLRPFNSGILLFALDSQSVIAALAGCQATLRAASHCSYGDQPFFNEYFGALLLTSWRFFCALPLAAELAVLSQSLDVQAGNTLANAQCSLFPNRAMLYTMYLYKQFPALKIDTHTLVHIVFPTNQRLPKIDAKRADFLGFIAYYFPAMSADVLQKLCAEAASHALP